MACWRGRDRPSNYQPERHPPPYDSQAAIVGNMKREPLWTVAGIVAAVAAIITLATSFGLSITAEQHEAILGVVAVAAPLIVAWVGRGRVYSPDTVDRLAEEAAVLDPLADDIEFDDEFDDDEDEDEDDDDDPLVDDVPLETVSGSQIHHG